MLEGLQRGVARGLLSFKRISKLGEPLAVKVVPKHVEHKTTAPMEAVGPPPSE
jgi:hypothetical protein